MLRTHLISKKHLHRWKSNLENKGFMNPGFVSLPTRSVQLFFCIDSPSKVPDNQFATPSPTRCRALVNRLVSHPFPASSFAIRPISSNATRLSVVAYRGRTPSLERWGEAAGTL